MALSRHFIDGFEKEGGLKEWALAGLLAGSPAISHAGGGATREAISHASQAAQKQWGHLLEKAPNAVKSVANKSVTVGSGAAKTKINLKNLKRLEVEHGPFQASLEGNEAKAKYNVAKGVDLVAKSGPEKYFGVNYSKEF